MKKLLSIFIALIAIVALVTPASAQNFATITTATITGQSVATTGSVPCPDNYAVGTVVNSWKVKIYITAEPNPYAGVCPPEANPIPFSVTVDVTLARAKSVYVNDVLIGTMYP